LGIVVGRLRIHEDKKVADLAKETVRKWKNDVSGTKKPEHASSSAGSSGSTGKVGSPTISKTGVDGSTTMTANGAVKQESTGAKTNRDATSDRIPKDHTKDKTRDGGILQLYNAIVLDSAECMSPLPHTSPVIWNAS
jgi:hypothetical protein